MTMRLLSFKLNMAFLAAKFAIINDMIKSAWFGWLRANAQKIPRLHLGIAG